MRSKEQRVADLTKQGAELASTLDGLRDQAALFRNELLSPTADSPDSLGSEPADDAESSSEVMCPPPEVGGSLRGDAIVSI
jgi:hypothetical protein